jgi:hypothetical protein
MLKFVATTVLGCCGLVCSVCDAGTCCNAGCNCNCACSPAAATASMPGMPGMPMPAAPQANAGTQYRTYSYQPAPTYRPNSRTTGGANHDAGWKIRGGN